MEPTVAQLAQNFASHQFHPPSLLSARAGCKGWICIYLGFLLRSRIFDLRREYIICVRKQCLLKMFLNLPSCILICYTGNTCSMKTYFRLGYFTHQITNLSLDLIGYCNTFKSRIEAAAAVNIPGADSCILR